MTRFNPFNKLTVVLCAVIMVPGLLGQGVTAQAHTPVANGNPDTQAKAGIQWAGDPGAALSQAKQQGRLIFVDVGASWCGWCRKMDDGTYTDPNVISLLNNNFVCVKLDADDGGIGSQFTRQLGIDALPTVVVINPQTKKYTVFTGYLDAQKFIAMVTNMETQLTANA